MEIPKNSWEFLTIRIIPEVIFLTVDSRSGGSQTGDFGILGDINQKIKSFIIWFINQNYSFDQKHIFYRVFLIFTEKILKKKENDFFHERCSKKPLQNLKPQPNNTWNFRNRILSESRHQIIRLLKKC